MRHAEYLMANQSIDVIFEALKELNTIGGSPKEGAVFTNMTKEEISKM